MAAMLAIPHDNLKQILRIVVASPTWLLDHWLIHRLPSVTISMPHPHVHLRETACALGTCSLVCREFRWACAALVHILDRLLEFDRHQQMQLDRVMWGERALVGNIPLHTSQRHHACITSIRHHTKFVVDIDGPHNLCADDLCRYFVKMGHKAASCIKYQQAVTAFHQAITHHRFGVSVSHYYIYRFDHDKVHRFIRDLQISEAMIRSVETIERSIRGMCLSYVPISLTRWPDFTDQIAWHV